MDVSGHGSPQLILLNKSLYLIINTNAYSCLTVPEGPTVQSRDNTPYMPIYAGSGHSIGHRSPVKLESSSRSESRRTAWCDTLRLISNASMPKVPVVDLSPCPKAKTSSKKSVLGGGGTLNDMLNNAERKLRLSQHRAVPETRWLGNSGAIGA